MPPTKAKTITATLDKERETKRTIRYVESVADGADAVIGTIYIPKRTLAEIGTPDSVTVTITA